MAARDGQRHSGRGLELGLQSRHSSSSRLCRQERNSSGYCRFARWHTLPGTSFPFTLKANTDKKQCAAVNFVAGTAAGPATGCTNSTGVTMSYADDATLDTAYRSAGASTATSSATSSATAATSATPSATQSSAAASGFAVPSATGLGVVSWMVLLSAGTMACVLL
jgi:hypothetical protein